MRTCWLFVLIVAAAAIPAPCDRDAHARPGEPASITLRVARATAKNRARFAAGDDPIATRTSWPATLPSDRDAVLALGAAAFASFPAGVDATWELHIDDDRALAKAGVTIDANGEAVGLLFVEQDGAWRAAYSCMLCHSRSENGSVRAGPANAALRYGDLLADAYPEHPRAAEWRAWGAGRVDVTPDDEVDPLRIPDLVGLDSVAYLQQSGAFAVVSTGSLAQRIASVLLRSPVDHGAVPSLSSAIAAWLRVLPEPTPPSAADEGAHPFRAHCARCHDGPALGGRHLIDAAEVGTDASAADSALRGTGSYRVPPLLGAGSRARFLHDGALSRLADVIDPRRLDAAFRGGALGAGPVPGHPWGTNLDEKTRASIVAFLASSRW